MIMMTVAFACVFVILAQWYHERLFHADLRGEYVAYNPELLDKVAALVIADEFIGGAESTPELLETATVIAMRSADAWQSGWGDPWLEDVSWWDRPLLYGKGSPHWPRRLVFLTNRKATSCVSVPQLSESAAQTLGTLKGFEYDVGTQTLSFTGRMTRAQLRDALTVSKATEYRTAVERLFYLSSGNGLAIIDDQQLPRSSRVGLANFFKLLNRNLAKGSAPITAVMLKSLHVPKGYILCGVEHGDFLTRGTAVTIGCVIVLVLVVLFVRVRKPEWVLSLHRGTYGLVMVVVALMIPNLFLFGVEEEKIPVFHLNRPWGGRMPIHEYKVNSYDPLPDVTIPDIWQGRFRVDTARNTLWYRGDVLTPSEEKALAKLADSDAYRNAVMDLGSRTREWAYHGNRPSVSSLVKVFDSVRNSEEFRRTILWRFPICYRDLDFGRIGGLLTETERVAVPRIATVLFTLLGVVIVVGVVTLTGVKATSCIAQESIDTGGEERRTVGRVLMLLAHPFRSAKLLPVNTDWHRRLAALLLMVWSTLVAGNVLLARLTYEPAYPHLSGVGLGAEVLLIAWGCLLGGAGLWLAVFLIGNVANWVRQRPALVSPGEAGARVLIVTVIWAVLITVFVIAGLLIQEAGLRQDWVPDVLMVIDLSLMLAAITHIIVVVVACCRKGQGESV